MPDTHDDQRTLDLSDLLSADIRFGQPSLRPGDVVKTPRGNVGVVTKATTGINGYPWSWDEFPVTPYKLEYQTASDTIDHGDTPQYAIAFHKDSHEKYAWWRASELAEVLSIGPFHK